MLIRKILSIAILFSLLFAVNAASGKSFPVIKNGKVIVELMPDEDQACLEASMLVEQYLGKAVGNSRIDAPAGAPQICFKIEKGKMDVKGFRFSFPAANKMVITGGGPNGVKFGALDFCERFIGVRFLYPGPAGEHVPKLKNLNIPMKEFSDAPLYHTRILDSGNRHWSRKRYQDWYPYLRGCAPYRLAIGHNLYKMFPAAKYGKTNPDFYPIIDGKRFIPRPPRLTVHWQPCMTNPAVVKEAVRMICDAFAKNPDLRTWSLGQTDGNGYCECENCKKFYPANDVPHIFGSKDRSLLYLQFCNKIAEGVTKKYPEAKFSVFAYNHTSIAPKGFKLHPSLVPVITYDRLNWVDPKRKAMDMERQKSWSDIAAEVCWWDYYASNGYVLPRITLHHIANQLREGYKLRVRHAFIQHTPLGIHEQTWAEGPLAYMTYKLLWNPFQDENKIIDDWCRTAVGPKAAPYLKRYYERFEKFWTKDMPRGDWFKRCARTYLIPTWHDYLLDLDKDFFQECEKDLDMVCKLAPAGDCKVRAEYIRFGFRERQNRCQFWLRNRHDRLIGPKYFTKEFFKDDFNKGLGQWTEPPNIKNTGSVLIAPKAGYDGSDALELRFLPIMNGTVIEKIFPITRKGTFRMEVKYRSVGVEPGFVSMISSDWCDKNGKSLNSVFYSDLHGRDASGDWQTMAFNFTVPDQLPTYLKVRIGSCWSKKGTIFFDDFVIREIPGK